MKSAPSTKPEKCIRCGKKYGPRRADAHLWTDSYDAGYLQGKVCGGCLTSEEHLQAEVDDAMAAGTNLVDFDSLPREQQVALMDEALFKRTAKIVQRHIDLAKASGETHMKLDFQGWARESVDGWQAMSGVSQRIRDKWYVNAEFHAMNALHYEVPQELHDRMERAWEID